MRIAVLGTGIMGAPMARNLARAGHHVVAWNRTAAKARALGHDGVRAAKSPADAVAGAEVVLTMLADAAAVEDVIGQTLDVLALDAIWWQASTIGLEGDDRMQTLADQRGIEYVDGPVLGTKEPAEQGKLIVLASGSGSAIDRLLPAFKAVSSQAVRLGEAGEGTRAKLVLNHWVLALTTAVGETIALARAMGVDPDLFLEIIAGGPLDAGYAQTKGGMIIDDVVDDPSFPLRHALKDAELVMAAARRHDVDLGLAPAIRERYARAVEAGLGDSDMAAVARVSGAPVRRA